MKEEVNVNQIEYCAVEKEIAINRIKFLNEKYADVFQEYNMWVSILNSPVTLVD